MRLKTLELLAPAANAEIAIQAVTHGADAVYIGAVSHGARKSASNSLEDIARVVEYAHRYRSRVYVTVNTIVYEHELRQVETLCRKLYRIGVDALIVQDMSLLRLDLPPIALHASTQCDIRTPEKARFLQEMGFSQLVLARELTLEEIRGIAESVTIPVECFVHGALCVSYSGRCHASYVCSGRSANRGECAQVCRLPYSLYDAEGRLMARDKYLLSLQDLNASSRMSDLIEAGVSSFKIEGRLKDMDYVKNITAHYSFLLNRYISENPSCYRRSSYGISSVSFNPRPEKSFNRGFTDYFLSERKPASIASMRTSKSFGEKIRDVQELNNGDGISFFDKNGIYQGVNVNKIDKGKIIAARRIVIPKNAEIFRTYDLEWQKNMSRHDTAVRKLALKISVDPKGVTAKDERGVEVRLLFDVNMSEAKNPMDYRPEFSKLGNTPYNLVHYESSLDSSVFIPRSEIGRLRRRMIEMLEATNTATYKFDSRRKENRKYPYPFKAVDFRDNVANSVSYSFYKEHGVEDVQMALELSRGACRPSTVLMTTRHCILRELGLCKKAINKTGIDVGDNYAEPFQLVSGNRRFRLRFDCLNCEMHVLSV